MNVLINELMNTSYFKTFTGQEELGNIWNQNLNFTGADLGGGCRGCAPLPEMTCGFLIQLVFCNKKKKWIIGVEVEQETSEPPPKKNPGSAPDPDTLKFRLP